MRTRGRLAVLLCLGLVAVVAATARSASAISAQPSARPLSVETDRSGAIVNTPGCYQSQLPVTTFIWRLVDLPFWINFHGRAYRQLTVSKLGYVAFDVPGGGPGQQDPAWSLDENQYQEAYGGYPRRVIAPFWSKGSADTPSGAPVTTYGETTFQGRRAFCVLWTDWRNVHYCLSSPIGSFSTLNTVQLLLVERQDTGLENFDVVFNYGSIEWDHPGIAEYEGGTKCGDAAGAGWKVPSGPSALVSGSWTYDAFLDSNQTTGLIHRSLGSTQLGRFVWPIRNAGGPPEVAPIQTLGPPPTGPTLGVPGIAVNPTAGAGEPVNTATGSYYTSTTDLALAGIGVPFTLTRSYNSADASDGPLGPGWTHSLNDELTIEPSGDVVARSGDGQQVRFTRNGDGSFSGVSGVRSTLAAVAGGYELTTNDQIHLRFDASGLLVSKRDRNAQGLALTRNPDGTVAAVVDSAGRNVSFAYAAGRLTSVTLPDGRNVQYGYEAGRLETVTDTRSGVTRYTYDTAGRLKTIVDQNNNTVVDNTYGSDGRVIQQVDPLGTSTFTWDPVTQTSAFRDARGNEWKDIYWNNVLIEQIDPLGNRTHFRYDDNLSLVEAVDARGVVTTMTYDVRGNQLTRAVPALNHRETFTYTSLNDIATHTDARNNNTRYEYDVTGNLTKVIQPDPDVGSDFVQTIYERDPGGTGLLKRLVDPRGKATTFGHDAQGNLTSITTQLGNKTTMSHDASGRVTSRVEPRGNVTGASPSEYDIVFTYDNADHVLTVTDPLDALTTYTYDPAGNLEAIKDANNRTTRYGYDAANHINLVVASDLSETRYGYDAVGNLRSRTDANTHVTTYEYDATSRLSSVLTPGGRNWTFGYDEVGNRTSIVDAVGNATPTVGDGTTSYAYDALNRLTGVGYGGTTAGAGFTLDGNGNRTRMTDGQANSLNYSYDNLNRLTSVSRGQETFGYAYDQAGNVVRRTYPGNLTSTYAYDDDERLASVTRGSDSTIYGYDPAANLVSETLPSGNGYVITRSYDRAGRFTSIDHRKGTTSLATVALDLDPVGNPRSAVQTGLAPLTATYLYDVRDRLTEVCYQAAACTSGSSPFIRWAYDPVGNRTSETRPTGAITYSYDVDDRLLTAGSTTFDYDLNGNQTRAAATAFAYDLANRMTTATAGTTTTTYTYDGDGKRIKASTGSQASKNTNFAWDVLAAVPQVAVETDGSGALLRQYLYGHDRIAMTTGGTQGGTFYYHPDQLGSVLHVTSAAGATQWNYAYEPFGMLKAETKVVNKAPSNSMKFTGEHLDATGLYHLRARQYDPAAGRLLAIDPLPTSTMTPYSSTYSYVQSRPTVLVDPTGLLGLPRWGAAERLTGALDAVRDAAGTVAGAAAQYAVEHPMLVTAGAAGVCVAGAIFTVGGSCVAATSIAGAVNVGAGYRESGMEGALMEAAWSVTGSATAKGVLMGARYAVRTRSPNRLFQRTFEFDPRMRGRINDGYAAVWGAADLARTAK